MSKQLTFSEPTVVTKVYSDGRQERLTYGYYESVMIIKENGHPVHRTKILSICSYPVTEVECEDGTKLIFDEPLYCIEKGSLNTERSSVSRKV